MEKEENLGASGGKYRAITNMDGHILGGIMAFCGTCLENNMYDLIGTIEAKGPGIESILISDGIK